MERSTIETEGDGLYRCLRARTTVAPLTERLDDIGIEDAYHISRRMVQRRIEAGETIIGKKIGVTSDAVQSMLGVRQPDFGFLTDAMRFEDGDEMPISKLLIQPRAEGEIAFVLNRDLKGPGVSNADVLSATERVHACFEIVDSRIVDWQIKIQDTVADNASSGLFVLGRDGVSPADLDLEGCKIQVSKNGAPLSEGFGSASLGSPLTSVAWLANTLGEFDIELKAGEVILSGSLVPLEPVTAGDRMVATISGIGSVSVNFT